MMTFWENATNVPVIGGIKSKISFKNIENLKKYIFGN